MIRIFRNKNDIPEDMEYIQLNDIFFNEITCDLIDEKAKDIIRRIDSSDLISKYKIKSRFGDDILNIDKLSSGCKTVLNVLYNPDKVFWLLDCGENALDILFSFETGNVFSETPMLPFNIGSVEVCTSDGSKIINDYEDLKAWWFNE